MTIKSRGKSYTALTLLDIGSSLGYVELDFAKRCKLKQEGIWSGRISTLHGTKQQDFPIYVVNMVDKDGKVIKAKFLGSPEIGYKQGLPQKLFHKLCEDFKLPVSSVQNPSGCINLLVGLDQCSLLANKTGLTNPNYPQLYLCESQLSSQYIFCGSLGRELLDAVDVETQCFKSDILCFSVHHVTTPENDESLFAIHPANKMSKYDQLSYLPREFKKLKSMVLALQTSFYRVNQQNSLTDSAHPERGDRENAQEREGATNRVARRPQIHVEFEPQTIDCSQNEGPRRMNNYWNSSVVLQAKPSPLTHNVEDATAVPSLACSSCSKMLQSCRSCKYLSSELSIMDLKQLKIIRESIKLIPAPAPESGERVLVDYPFTVNINEAFHHSNSNINIAKKNTERLRQRLMKINMHQVFHEEMLKTLE